MRPSYFDVACWRFFVVYLLSKIISIKKERLRQTMRVVMKFGGTSIGNGSNFGQVAQIINSYAESNETIVLVSAMAGVTDQLIDCAERSQKDIKKEVLRDFIQELLKKHLKAAEESIDDEFILKEVEEKLIETSLY